MASLESLDYPQAELVIGLVAPVGTDTNFIVGKFKERLNFFDYITEEIHLSDFLKEHLNHGVTIDESSNTNRYNSLMKAGNELRNLTKRGDALSLLAVAKIFKDRTMEGENCPRKAPKPSTAYILNSLKHPDEVELLRRVYGSGFYLIGIHSTENKRIENLQNNKQIAADDALALIKRDENEETRKGFGQKTRDTFHLADAFLSSFSYDEAEKQIWRLLDLVFGDPFTFPTRDEHSMFLSFATSFRSADLSRQVGAVVTSSNGELIGMGVNDVPCSGGGLYWSGGDEDHRDYTKEVDSNAVKRGEILADIARVVKMNVLESVKKNVEASAASNSAANSTELRDSDTNSEKEDIVVRRDDPLIDKIRKELAGSLLLDITEFGRPVHAEMEAILSCGRVGASAVGGTLYCTTFPCHNCAKHIIASGIERVVYVEPYPKSQAKDLYGDEIALEGDATVGKKVFFQPFVGIGPRRFTDLFSMGLGSGHAIRRKVKGSSEKYVWSRESTSIRVPMLPSSYIEREAIAATIAIEEIIGEKNESNEEDGK